jgi:hypothetical protein
MYDLIQWLKGVIMKQKKTIVSKIFYISIFILFASAVAYSASNDAKPLTAKELYELKERCGKTCAQWFKEEFCKEGIYSDKTGSGTRSYTSHYNVKLNKCFVLVEDRVYSKPQSTLKTLFDINENKRYGDYFRMIVENHVPALDCSVLEKRCKSEAEWDSLVKPYMEE